MGKKQYDTDISGTRLFGRCKFQGNCICGRCEFAAINQSDSTVRVTKADGTVDYIEASTTEPDYGGWRDNDKPKTEQGEKKTVNQDTDEIEYKFDAGGKRMPYCRKCGKKYSQKHLCKNSVPKVTKPAEKPITIEDAGDILREALEAPDLSPAPSPIDSLIADLEPISPKPPVRPAKPEKISIAAHEDLQLEISIGQISIKITGIHNE